MAIKRHAAIGFIFVTIMLDMLAFGIAAPTLPKLISDFLHGDPARASEYLGFFVTTFAFMQFFFSPVLGLNLRPLWTATCRAALELRTRS